MKVDGGGVDVAPDAGVKHFGALVEVGSAGLKHSIHISNFCLKYLELTQFFAELFAFSQILK